MDRERWLRTVELYNSALELPVAERLSYVRAHADGDDELFEEVVAMLEDPPAEFVTPPFEGLPQEDPTGSTIHDFEIRKTIGVGGMGTVYLAHQASLNREVALKVVRQGPGIDAAAIVRFEQESRRAASLEHPNIVPVYSSGSSPTEAYFAMPVMRGGTLQERIAAARAARESIDVDLAVRWIAGIADALAAVHAARILHRDVKPANILLDENDKPYLTDFGISRGLVEETVTHGRGTPAYMSPEQAEFASRTVDERSDIYSLGVVLYELLTLRRPHEAETHEDLLRAIREEEPASPRTVAHAIPRDLETICQRAMRKSIESRYQSAVALATDLRLYLQGRTIMARPVGALERASEWLSRHAALVGGLAAGLLAVGSAVAVEREQARRAASRVALAEVTALVERASERSSTADSRAALDALERGAVEIEALDPSDPDVARVRSELEAETQAVFEETSQQLEAFLGSARVDPFGVAYGRLVEVSIAFERARRLADRAVPEQSASLQRLDDLVGTRISIRSVPEGATVVAHRLDPLSLLPLDGAVPTILGQTPIEARPIDAGTYHLLLADEDARRGPIQGESVVRAFVLGASVPVEVPTVYLRPVDPPDTVRFPAGEMVVHQRESHLASDRRVIELPTFNADVAEVTCREYGRFVRETGHERPYLWPSDESPETAAWGDLPVAWVSLHDALAYSAWAGRRLPIFYEYSRMARGLEAAEAPWAGGVEEITRRANVAPSSAAARRIPRQVDPNPELDLGATPVGRRAFAVYRDAVRSADEAGGDVTPDGLVNLIGNLAEWTLATGTSEVSGHFVSLPTEHIFRGNSWRHPASPLEVHFGVPAQARNDYVGLRTVSGPPPASLELIGR